MSANNATIAFPGPDWHFLWPDSFADFQLDIVGFLAILGEGSIQSVAQVSALSRLFYLPRLLPAPQALLRTSRPSKLDPTDAAVSAIHSGNFKDHLHHVANVLLGEEMKPFTVRCVKVTKKTKDKYGRQASWTDAFFRGVSRKDTSQSSGRTTPPVKAKANGPLLYVTLLAFLLSLALFIISITLGDPMSLVATVLLSLLSSLIGIGNKWNLKLPKRPETQSSEQEELSSRKSRVGDIEQDAGKGPAGETTATTPEEPLKEIENSGVVIRYPNGSYMVVLCNEDVARELYFAPEEIAYTLKSPTRYRLISLVGTLMLMLGVIFLANAKLQLQICWGGAYVILNAAHWLAAAVPAKRHWDVSCYNLEEQGLGSGPENENFTGALWKAIMFARSSRWVRIGKHAAPQTPVWDKWLEQAEEEAKSAKPEKDKTLKKPLFKNQKIGTVWKRSDWDAKTAYDDLEKANRGKPVGATRDAAYG